MRRTVFCDASFDRRTKACGVGLYFPQREGDDANVSLPVEGMLDCNHGEVYALHKALESMRDLAGDGVGEMSLVVYVDSDHAYELLYEKRTVSDGREDEKARVLASRKLLLLFGSVQVVCLKSHQAKGPVGMSNDHCDRLAKKAMRELRDRV